MIATTVYHPQSIAPSWSYARQIVMGTADVPVLDKAGAPLPMGTFIVFQAISDNGTGDARIKFSPNDY